MKATPTVSIIVPGYNRGDLSKQALTDILATNDMPDAEIIFVDDGSSDEVTPTLAQMPGVTYVRHDKNRGVSPAWNTGIKAASGDVVIIANNDIRVVDRSWVSRLVAAVSSGKVIAGPEIVENDWAVFNGKRIPYLTGWLYAFPRRFFTHEIGYFDEAYAPASYEDVDIVSRALAAGYTQQRLDLRIQHAYSQTVSAYLHDQMPALNARNKAIWLGKMAASHKRRLKIIIDCASNGRKWGPTAFEDEGLGGAEMALTLVTRELVTRGHEVYVYNDAPTPADDGGYGVVYRNRAELVYESECDVFIAFRCPSAHLRRIEAQKRIFWSCDQQTTPPSTWDSDLFPYVDTTVCISDYHIDFLAARHHLSRSAFTYLPCPIRPWDYEPHVEKDPNQFIFCSVPERGLTYMPMVMSEIRKEIPEARLVITSDYRLWGSPTPRNEHFKPLFKAPLDEFKGMVPRADLVQLQAASMAQPYPCTYEEAQCLSVLECASAGAVPISTDIGAVKQTIGDGGFVVGTPDGDFAKRIAKQTLEIYGDQAIMRQAVERSWRFSVVAVVNEWETLMYEGLDLSKNDRVAQRRDAELQAARQAVEAERVRRQGQRVPSVPPKGRPDLVENPLRPGEWQLPNGDRISTRDNS